MRIRPALKSVSQIRTDYLLHSVPRISVKPVMRFWVRQREKSQIIQGAKPKQSYSG